MCAVRTIFRILATAAVLVAIYAMGSGHLVGLVAERIQGRGATEDKGMREPGTTSSQGAEFDFEEDTHSASPEQFVQMGKVRLPIRHIEVSQTVDQVRREKLVKMARNGYVHLADEMAAGVQPADTPAILFDVFIGPDQEIVCSTYQTRRRGAATLVGELSVSSADVGDGGKRLLQNVAAPDKEIPATDLGSWQEVVSGKPVFAAGDEPGGHGYLIARAHAMTTEQALSDARGRLESAGFAVQALVGRDEAAGTEAMRAERGGRKVQVSAIRKRSHVQTFYRFASSLSEH